MPRELIEIIFLFLFLNHCQKINRYMKVSKYGVFSGPNTGKYGSEKTPYLDIFQAVQAMYYYMAFPNKHLKSINFLMLVVALSLWNLCTPKFWYRYSKTQRIISSIKDHFILDNDVNVSVTCSWHLNKNPK